MNSVSLTVSEGKTAYLKMKRGCFSKMNLRSLLQEVKDYIEEAAKYCK